MAIQNRFSMKSSTALNRAKNEKQVCGQMSSLPYGSSYPPVQLPTPELPIRQRKGVLPQRTTKTTQKMVLFPDDSGLEHKSTENLVDQPDEPLEQATFAVRTLPEKLLKEQRRGLARVTSYCVAEQFNLDNVINYLKDYHVIMTKKFDECLYYYYEPAAKERVFGFANPGSPQIHLGSR